MHDERSRPEQPAEQLGVPAEVDQCTAAAHQRQVTDDLDDDRTADPHDRSGHMDELEDLLETHDVRVGPEDDHSRVVGWSYSPVSGTVLLTRRSGSQMLERILTTRRLPSGPAASPARSAPAEHRS